MNEPRPETPDLSPSSLSFQIVVSGTLVFLVALFWLTSLPHANTHEAQMAAAAARVIVGIQAVGCYVAFLGIVFAHKLLQDRQR